MTNRSEDPEEEEEPQPAAVAPAIHATLRQFWLVDFAAKSAGQPDEIHALNATRSIVKALMLEIQACQGINRLAAERSGDMAEGRISWTINVLETATNELVEAASVWYRTTYRLQHCEETARALGMHHHSLMHECMRQRVRIMHHALKLMQRQLDINRARLQAGGHQEVLFL